MWQEKRFVIKSATGSVLTYSIHRHPSLFYVRETVRPSHHRRGAWIFFPLRTWRGVHWLEIRRAGLQIWNNLPSMFDSLTLHKKAPIRQKANNKLNYLYSIKAFIKMCLTLRRLNSEAVALHFLIMSTLLPCTHQRFPLNRSKKCDQSAQYAWLGQWAISPFEDVNAFDRWRVDPPDCG